MNRLTDHDRTWGPFTVAPWKNSLSAYLESGDDEDPESCLLLIAAGRALRVRVPRWLCPPQRERVEAHWDAETRARLGRNWYYKIEERRFGFSLSSVHGKGFDFFQFYYGPQTNDSKTDCVWCKSLPWKQWRHVRTSYYAPDGSHFYTESNADPFKVRYERQDACPTVRFEFDDYDAKRIVATCKIEEREWHWGEGWFRWLRHFARPLVRRSLDLHFSEEVGPEKGSWKGGTIGHGIEMLPGETPEQAFRRYCEKDHRAKGNRTYRLRFVGPCQEPAPAAPAAS